MGSDQFSAQVGMESGGFYVAQWIGRGREGGEMNENCNLSEQESRRRETSLLRGIKSFGNGTVFPFSFRGRGRAFSPRPGVLKFLLVITARPRYYLAFVE